MITSLKFPQNGAGAAYFPLKSVSVIPALRFALRSATSRAALALVIIFTSAHRSAPAHQVFGPLRSHALLVGRQNACTNTLRHIPTVLLQHEI